MRAHFGGSSRKSLVASRVLLDAAVKGADANVLIFAVLRD